MSEKAVAKLWAESSHDALCKILEDTPQSVLRTYAPNTLSWLGVAAAIQGRYGLARVPLTLALMKQPDYLDHSLNLGNCLRMLGEHQAALDVFNKGLQKKLDAELFAGACFCALELRQGADLIILGEAFVKFSPRDPRAHYYFGNALHSFEHFKDAAEHLKKSLELDPISVKAARLLALSLLRATLIPQANDVVNQIIASGQYDDEFMVEASSVAVEMGASIIALEWYRCVEELASLKYKFLISEVYRSTGSIESALLINEKVLEIEPSHLAARLSNISMLRQIGRFEEAGVFETSLHDYDVEKMSSDFKPNPWASFSVTSDAQIQFKLAKRWGDEKFNKIPREKIYAAPRRNGSVPRIGFLSPDFGDHPVGHIAKKIISASKGMAEIVCFSSRRDEDKISHEIASNSSDFIRLYGKAYPEVKRLALDSKLDVMVDLAAYTTGGLPGHFAKGLCHRQVSYLGYSGTTGAQCYDQIILDAYLCPAKAEKNYSEETILLNYPLMFPALEDTTALVSSGKARFGIDEESVLFGCLASLYKVSIELIHAWGKVLERVSGSYLLLGPADPKVQMRIKDIFSKIGVEQHRIIFSDREPTREQHLARLKAVDLFLDTYPYNAHSLAADAVSAGVPVVTVNGNSYASRVAGSLMSHLGYDHLTVPDLTNYISNAVELGTNPSRLVEVRLSLLEKVSAAVRNHAHVSDLIQKIAFGKAA